jgi:uncharacterized protein involved in exopolysaccharide biosynthesis
MGTGFESDPEPEGKDRVDLRFLFVHGVKRSRGWIVLLALLGVAAGIALGLARPDTFASNSKLLLRMGAREQITSESLVGLESERRGALPTMVDELQMLSDTAIFERVARKLGPQEILRPADPGQDDTELTGTATRWWHRVQSVCLRATTRRHDCTGTECAHCLRLATKRLIEDTTVTNQPGSNVILVEGRASSPLRAQAAVREIAAAFIERHREQFSIQSLVEANRGKVEASRKVRDDSVAAYVEHLHQGGFEDVDPEVPALQAEVTALEGELFTVGMRRKAVARQRESLSGRLEVTSAEVPLAGPVVMVPNEEYETQLMLKRSLLGQKQSLALEGRTLEETRRREKVIDAQIEQVDLKLRQLPKAVAQDAELRANLGHVVLSTRVEDLELEDQELAVKLDLLQARLGEKQTRLREVRRQVLLEMLQRKDLESARDAAESSYRELRSRFSVLEALGSIELHEDPNLRVLQAATLDPERTGPKRLALILKALLAALFVGVALAMLRQGLDRGMSLPETFARASGVPVIGVVPELRGLRRLSTRPPSRWSPS